MRWWIPPFSWAPIQCRGTLRRSGRVPNPQRKAIREESSKRKRAVAIFLVLAALPWAVEAQIIPTGTVLRGLYSGPVPPGGLPLPPNNVEVRAINPDTGYYSDAVRMVDCPADSD